jgi:hypothetical protein
MQRLIEQILWQAEGLPEGTPVAAKSLLHLGNRPAVDQTLLRLAGRCQLISAGRGLLPPPGHEPVRQTGSLCGKRL